MRLEREQWAQISALLDDALDLDPEQRDEWLARLPDEHAALQEPLRALLAQRAHVETDDFLKSPDFAAALSSELARREAAAPDFEAGMRVGAYRLTRELGRGGMGHVWLAERVDGRFQREVALKFPYAGINRRELAERLGRERDILARLEHPNIARLYDADTTELDQPFLVLEYIDGLPINDYCDQHQLPVRERLVLFLQVLGATQYAHAHLVIHRDLKPSNILITSDRVARLLDFGIAKLIPESGARETALTQVGGRALTPDYASPEQINGEPISTASDVYSLGVVLYELLTGTRPYRLRRDSRASLEDAIAEADIIAPSRAAFSSIIADQRAASARKLAQLLRGDLDAIIHKALQTNPAERYASVDALTRDITHWLDGEVVLARRPGVGYRLRKLIRRHRLPFAAACAVFLSLLAGATVAIWQARIALAQAERLQATKSFLIDVFNSNSKEQEDPLKAQQTTARELLDRAAERLNSKHQPSPEEAEEMLSILGSLYQDLGLDDKSASLRLRRVSMLRTLHGPDDPRVAAAQIDYAKSIYATDDWRLARGPLEDAERILDMHHDTSSYTRGQLLGAMSEYLRGVDRIRSREYAERGIALERRYFPGSAQLVDDLRLDALIDSETGNRARALPLMEEALAVQESSGGPEINLIRPLAELAELQSLQQNNAAAEQNFRRGLALSQRLNGESHVDTIQTRLRYGKFLRGDGRLLESEAMLMVAEENAVKLLGNAETFHLPTVRNELAQTEYSLGNYALAADLYKRAIAARETTRSGNRQHANMLANYARLLTDMGHADQSEVMLTRAAGYYEKSEVPVGASDVPVFLSVAYAAMGRLPEALEVLDRYPQGREGSTAVMRMELDMQRAAVYAAMGGSRKAEPILVQQLQILREWPAADSLRLLEATGRIQLGRALLERHAVEEACEMLDSAMQVRKKDLAPHSPLLADSEIALAECLLVRGDKIRSRALGNDARSILDFNTELGDQFRQPLRTLKTHLAM